ncbi:hypothetical protein Tco_0232405 [Tanacetum coccineum]
MWFLLHLTISAETQSFLLMFLVSAAFCFVPADSSLKRKSLFSKRIRLFGVFCSGVDLVSVHLRYQPYWFPKGRATPELMDFFTEKRHQIITVSVDDSLPHLEVMRPVLNTFVLLSCHPCSTSVVHSYSVAVNPPGAEDIDLLLETGQ